MKIFDNIFVSADASIVAEDDFLVLMDAGCEAKTREDVLRLSKQTGKQVKYVFLTHSHWDHTHNVKFFKKKFPAMEIINSGTKKKFNKTTRMKLGNSVYTIMPTPGHSPSGNDICIYLEEKKILFTGDTCQPQGPDYHHTDFSTPVPYYHDGDAFIKSLKKLLKLEINHVITGHGTVFHKSALEVTLHATERIKELTMAAKNSRTNNYMICKSIFEQVSKERNFHGVQHRLKDPYYKECDIYSLMYWVKKFKGQRK